MPIIQILPYLCATLIIIIPLVFATAWDSFLVYSDKIWEGFGRGRVIDGIAGLLQIVLLMIPIVAITLTFALVGRRLGTVMWRWSEGKPALRAGLSSARFGLATVAVAAAAVALFTWLPNSDVPTTDSDTLKETLEKARSAPSAQESSSPQADETVSNPVTLAPGVPVPTVAAASPMSTEEESDIAPTAPTTTEEPATMEPPPTITEPVALTTTEPAPTVTQPASETPPNAPPSTNDPSIPSLRCTTSPGEEPASTNTRCTTN